MKVNIYQQRKKKMFTMVLSLLLFAFTSSPVHAVEPRVAVALGDSFISGEGAEAFIFGDGASEYMGTPPTPLFDKSNSSNSYFCHVSENSSIMVAEILGIDERINLACSGAEPENLTKQNTDRTGVKSQLNQLWKETEGKKIKVILVGMGANNIVHNFGGMLGFCHSAFMVDAVGGLVASGLWWEGAEEKVTNTYASNPDHEFPDFQEALDNNGCVSGSFYSGADLAAVTDSYVSRLDKLMQGMAFRGYAGNDWVLVIQGYASPFPKNPNELFLRQSGKADSSSKFADLAQERYAAGCPVHEASMRLSIDVAAALSKVAKNVADTIQENYPDNSIIYLDVQRAFDGGRLCENADSPNDSRLWNPIWFRDESNSIIREIHISPGRTLAGEWGDLAKACGDDVDGVFARCQDAGHPNKKGHKVLGKCLSKALAYSGSQDLECSRDPSTETIDVGAIPRTRP